MKEVTLMEDGLLNVVTAEATQGECNEPKGAPGAPATPDPEVPEKATRRKFSAEYKLRILRLADSCADPGSLGRLLRKEGLYSLNLTTLGGASAKRASWRGSSRPSAVAKPLNPILCCPSSKIFARKTIALRSA